MKEGTRGYQKAVSGSKLTKHRAPRLVDDVEADRAAAKVNVGVEDLVQEPNRRGPVRVVRRQLHMNAPHASLKRSLLRPVKLHRELRHGVVRHRNDVLAHHQLHQVRLLPPVRRPAARHRPSAVFFVAQTKSALPRPHFNIPSPRNKRNRNATTVAEDFDFEVFDSPNLTDFTESFASYRCSCGGRLPSQARAEEGRDPGRRERLAEFVQPGKKKE
jgi:hypothetical protein